tara:strand:+ start:53207 stop:54019 length:813 start_codon:yes stop_codon:yes gene_type:complete
MSAQTIQIPSLCIPRVFHRVTDRVIYGTFERLFGKGCIAELTMLLRQDRNTSEPYYLVFIHFNAYTSQVLIPRSASVSPTLEFRDDAVVETAEFVEDEIFQRITDFITQLDQDKEVRIEYRAPHYFKVTNYVPRKPRATPQPRILPKEESRATPARSPGNQSFDEYIKKMKPMQQWLKLNEVKNVLAEFSESKSESGSSPDILTRLEERWVEARRRELGIAEREWVQVPKKIQELVFDEFPPGGRIVNTPRKSEEEFRQILVAKFNMGEL